MVNNRKQRKENEEKEKEFNERQQQINPNLQTPLNIITQTPATPLPPQPEKPKPKPIPQTPANLSPFTVPDTPAVFRSETSGRPSGVQLPDGRTFLGLSQSDIETIVAARQRATAPIPGTQELSQLAGERRRIGEVSNILDPQIEAIEARRSNGLSLEPEPVQDILQRTLSNLGITGEGAVPGGQETLDEVAEFEKTAFGKAFTKLAFGATALAGLGTTAVAGRAAANIIRGSKALGVLKGTTSSLFGLAATGAAILGLGKLTDVNRGKINSHKGAIQELAAEVNAIKGEAEAGGAEGVAAGIKRLIEYEEELQDAEAAIKTLAANNLQFRIDDEHLEMEAEIRSARTDILERLQELRNLALQGQTSVNPNQLIVNAELLK